MDPFIPVMPNGRPEGMEHGAWSMDYGPTFKNTVILSIAEFVGSKVKSAQSPLSQPGIYSLFRRFLCFQVKYNIQSN